MVARVLFPALRRATARFLSPDSAGSSLGSLLGLGPVSGNELLANLDWLHQRQPFGIQSVVLAADRGRLSTASIRKDLSTAGLDWVSALKSRDLHTLLKQPRTNSNTPDHETRPPLRPGELQPDQVTEIRSPDFPGERLLVILNPRLKAVRARKRERLLRATEEILERIAGMVQRRSCSRTRSGWRSRRGMRRPRPPTSGPRMGCRCRALRPCWNTSRL